MVNKILFISALIGAVCIWWYLSNTTPVSQLKNPTQTFVVPKGQSTRTILKRLQQDKIIKSSLAAEIYLLLIQQRQGFQAGSFELSGSMQLNEVASSLRRGTVDIKATIPEGFRSEQIVDELIKSGLLANLNKQDLYQKFKTKEGQLFPDTYFFPKESTPEEITDIMVNTFSQKTNNQHPVTDNDLILASLVEREARHDIDRPLVASVLKNRLKIGMALQVDATLQYARATIANNQFDWWPQITSADKSINSPYNTYKFPGLPPEPIANPGIEAIEAVLNPAKTDYLYYVSEPDGTTHYAKNLEGHNANIQKYLMR
jgi:UPF0755 protein